MALLVPVIVIAACSDSDDTAGSAAGDMDVAEVAGGVAVATDESDEASAARSASGEGGGTGGSAAARLELPALDAKVVRTAELQIQVETGEFASAFRAASELGRSLGGFVQSSSTSSYDEGDASGDVTLRVPVDRYDEALRRLSELGRVESSSEEGEDVTAQLVDLDARIRALRAEEDALNALMADAANVNEVLSVRSTSVGVRQEIEQLAAQQKALEDRAAYSTIHALIHESSAEVEPGPDDDSWDLGDAWQTAVDAAEGVIGGMIVGIGLALPLAPIAAATWYVVRRRRRAHAA